MGFSIFDVVALGSDYENLDENQVPNERISIGGGGFTAIALLSMIAASNDTVPNVLTVWQAYYGGATPSRVASIIIPAGAGYGGVPAVNCLAGMAPSPLEMFIAMPQDFFYISLEASPSAGTTVHVSSITGTF